MTTYTDDFEVSGGRASGGGEYELLPEGTYLLEITKLEPFAGTKFGTTEPQDSVKITYTVAADPINGDWTGETVDQITPLVKNMANPNAKLHTIWKCATGETPQEGVTYKLKAGLLGRRVLGSVVHKVSSQGYTWPRIASLSPPPAAPARQRRGPQPPPPQDDDDDLADA